MFSFAHHNAKVEMDFRYHWRTTFVELESEEIRRRKAKPQIFLQFTDINAAVESEHWEELKKTITMRFQRVESEITLKDWCKQAINFVLHDPTVNTVDDSARLKTISVGRKLQCPHKLGGMPSFHFHYETSDKSNLENLSCYCIGALAGDRGYMITITCPRREELELYLSHHVYPLFCSKESFQVNKHIEEIEIQHEDLAAQRADFGELRYRDPVAAIAFSIPMHPMQIRPGFSPVQSFGDGSLAVLTLDLEVYQRWWTEGFDDADVAGLPKHKSNNVKLYIEVEDVGKMGFPAIMSIDDYSQQKLGKMIESLTSAQQIGTPCGATIGNRAGSSTSCTFTYDADGIRNSSHVKAMSVSTLVGNKGITALFFTRVGHGLFDAHLYIYRQLLNSVTFISDRELVPEFNRRKAANVRLVETDLPKVYAEAGNRSAVAVAKHAESLRCATDGRAEGAEVVKVGAEEAVERSTGEFADQVGDEAECNSIVSVSSIEHLNEKNVWDEPEEGEVGAPASPTDATTPAAEPAPGTHGSSPTEGTEPATGQPEESEPGKEPEAQPQQSSPLHGPEPVETGELLGRAEEQYKEVNETIKLLDEQDNDPTSLRDEYLRLCDEAHCKPNSYIVQKLPDNPRLKTSVEEFDLASNYLGKAGFAVALRLIEHLPNLHTVHFNDMSLDNDDIAALSQTLLRNKSVHHVHLRNNPKVSLPAAKHLFRLVRTNVHITTITLSGTKIGDGVIDRIEREAKAHAAPAQPQTAKEESEPTE